MKVISWLFVLGTVSQSFSATIFLEGFINGQWLSFAASGDSWSPPFQLNGGGYYENIAYVNPTGLLSLEVNLTGFDPLLPNSRLYDAMGSSSNGSHIVYIASYSAYNESIKSLWSHEIRLVATTASSICFECLIGVENAFRYSETVSTRSGWDPKNGIDGELSYENIQGFLTLKEYSPVTIPEPKVFLLFGIGLAMLGWLRLARGSTMKRENL